MNRIDELLKLTVDRGASDLHITVGCCPCIRVDGEIQFLNDRPVLNTDDTDSMLREIIPERNRLELNEVQESDFGYRIEGIGRFRVNVFQDLHGLAGVFRSVPEEVPSMESLGIGFAGVFRELCMHTKGLIIVTGPTGCGKSTTLAAMIDLINRTRKEHIITLEDPIEFVHRSKNCLLNQREVYRHTRSFPGALRAALREDPDVILLGEMRDLETTEIALETAETGHLVLATMHSNTATSTVDRIIDKFPGDRQNQIRTLLANTLTGIIAQTLCQRLAGGRVVASEILLATLAVRSNIREGKTHQLPTAIQTGFSAGMRSFTDSLFLLVQDGIVSPREAYLKAVDKSSLEQKFKTAGIPLDKSVTNTDSAHLTPDASIPDSPETLKEKAWNLATNNNSQSRDGHLALQLIEKALELGADDAEAFMVLAAAQAEVGNFHSAVETVKKALPLAKKEHNSVLKCELEHQMDYYKKSKPHPGTVA